VSRVFEASTRPSRLPRIQGQPSDVGCCLPRNVFICRSRMGGYCGASRILPVGSEWVAGLGDYPEGSLMGCAGLCDYIMVAIAITNRQGRSPRARS